MMDRSEVRVSVRMQANTPTHHETHFCMDTVPGYHTSLCVFMVQARMHGMSCMQGRFHVHYELTTEGAHLCAVPALAPPLAAALAPADAFEAAAAPAGPRP